MTDNAPLVTEQSEENPTTPDKKKCDPLEDPPKPPQLPRRKDCPQTCCCPTLPGGTPTECLDALDTLIESQAKIIKQADRASALLEELTAIQGMVRTAQADYTQTRYQDLLRIWNDQDARINDLVHKLVCGVSCWECLLECRLCQQLTDIRALEDRLNGTGDLTTQAFSLIDLQFWHQRNVVQMQAQVDRIKLVLSAWDKPSETLGDVLDKNAKLIEDTQQNISSDPAKAVYDLFMTLLPRHWAIRPRDAGGSKIDKAFIEICPCDEHKPDDCCGPDAGILSLRIRLLGPLPYIVKPADISSIICCLTKSRLTEASEQLASAQADLAITTAEIERVQDRIKNKTAAIEADFKAELGNPINCTQYKKKGTQPTAPTTSDTATASDGSDHEAV